MGTLNIGPGDAIRYTLNGCRDHSDYAKELTPEELENLDLRPIIELQKQAEEIDELKKRLAKYEKPPGK